MARRTKKVGITGKFGPRYGVTVRKKIKEASKAAQTPQKCPECQYMAVKRESSGIWVCRHCDLKFAASAYSIRTREFKKEQTKVLEYEELTEEQIAELQKKESRKPARRPRPARETVSEDTVEEEMIPEDEVAEDHVDADLDITDVESTEIEPDMDAEIKSGTDIDAEAGQEEVE